MFRHFILQLINKFCLTRLLLNFFRDNWSYFKKKLTRLTLILTNACLFYHMRSKWILVLSGLSCISHLAKSGKERAFYSMSSSAHFFPIWRYLRFGMSNSFSIDSNITQFCVSFREFFWKFEKLLSISTFCSSILVFFRVLLPVLRSIAELLWIAFFWTALDFFENQTLVLHSFNSIVCFRVTIGQRYRWHWLPKTSIDWRNA